MLHVISTNLPFEHSFAPYDNMQWQHAKVIFKGFLYVSFVHFMLFHVQHIMQCQKHMMHACMHA